MTRALYTSFYNKYFVFEIRMANTTGILSYYDNQQIVKRYSIAQARMTEKQIYNALLDSCSPYMFNEEIHNPIHNLYIET